MYLNLTEVLAAMATTGKGVGLNDTIFVSIKAARDISGVLIPGTRHTENNRG
jgi:hypothetical protein